MSAAPCSKLASLSAVTFIWQTPIVAVVAAAAEEDMEAEVVASRRRCVSLMELQFGEDDTAAAAAGTK